MLHAYHETLFTSTEQKPTKFKLCCAVYLPIMCTSPSVQQSQNMLNQRAKLAPLKQQQKLMLLHLLGQPREKFILHKVFPLFMFAQQLSVYASSVYLKIPHLRILHNFFLSEWKITVLQAGKKAKKMREAKSFSVCNNLMKYAVRICGDRVEGDNKARGTSGPLFEF